jgi:CBS domain containing-hemolysin-like protein
MTLYVWGVIFLLIAVNALYVAAEFATVSARRSRIQNLAEDGNGLAARLLPVLEDSHKLDTYIAACQIGITLSSLVLGAYGQATLAVQLSPWFQWWGGLQEVAAQSASAIVVLVFLTFLQMVLGELVPKSVALQYPTRTALYAVLPMIGSLKLFSWFIAVLNGSGLLLLKLIGMNQAGHRHIHSPEEIDLLIGESRKGGLLTPEEHRRLRRALRLGMRPVRQLAVPRNRVSAVNLDDPIDSIVCQVAGSPYTRMPAYRGSLDNVVGILHTQDLVLRQLRQGSIPSVADLVRPIPEIFENVTADQMLEILQKNHTHQAIVRDEFGGFVGLVSLDDVLAEILGEVTDEFKAGKPRPERLSDGRVRLPGLLLLSEAEPWLGRLRDGQSETVGGHVTEALGYFPDAGERLTIGGVEIEVEHVEGRVITSVLVRSSDPQREGQRG